MLGHWEHFEEGAGVGLRGFGRTVPEAFEQAALGLTAAVADPRLVWPAEAVALRCEAADEDLLLAAWLKALIEEMAARRMLFSRFEVSVDGNRLAARAWGELRDARRHRADAAPQAVLPAALRVARHADGWLAQAVVSVSSA